MARRPRNPMCPNCGFTLVELLVVIVILSILASLALSGMVAARARGRAAKTRTTIRKIHEVIMPYYESYETRRPVVPAGVESSGNRSLIARVRTLAMNRLKAMELPDNSLDVTEVFVPSVAYQIPGRVEQLNEVSPVARRYKGLIASANNNVTSSELLYLIVMRGAAADQDVIGHFRPDEIADTNGNGLQEFVDGWGNPIRFRRWPVGLVSPVQDGSSLLVPLIYSAGEDGEYGFDDSSASYRSLAYVPISAAAIVAGDPSKDNNDNHDMTK